LTQETPFAGLRGRTALVTGEGSGIGAALALRLGQLGVTVICTSRTQANIDAVAHAIIMDGGQATATAADATDPGDMANLAAALKAQCGGLDLAYLNAGGNWQKATILDSDPIEWRKGFDQT
jgi:NAD(P)-dependent dehydrogenase (short-subunit alcohol dehydrogenase family)